MPAPSPESPVSALDAAELELYRRLDEAALADEPISLSREDSDTARLVITELADRRRLGAFYGLKQVAAVADALGRVRAASALTADEPPATLADARDELLEDVIDRARGGDAPAADLDHLTAALERIERLIDLDAARGATVVDPERKALDNIASAARATVDAVRDSGLIRDHFTGRLEELYTHLEALDVELEAAGR